LKKEAQCTAISCRAPTLWHGEVRVVEGAGHATQWGKAEVFNKILDEFAPSL
jgi:pimeloyl-ACP methyl ester carboxylesterase